MTARDGTEAREVTAGAALWGLLILAAALRLSIGTSGPGWPSGEGGAAVLALRADRLAVAVIVGAALAVAGVALQALLRNALAEPFILGLSTGAAAGMVGQRLIASALGFALGVGYGGAAVGAGVSMAVVYLVSRRRGVLDPLGLLLTGVVLSTINGALIMLAIHFRPDLLRVEMSQWMMGFLGDDAGGIGSWLLSLFGGQTEGMPVPWRLLVIALVTLIGLAWLSMRARAMDVATLSPGEAEALGVDLRRLRGLLFAVASGLAASAVVLAGPIAFVGLVCPHVARLMFGARHRALLWASALLGSTLVVFADTAGAWLAWRLGVGIVPLGVFTALVGGVAFLWMLRPHLGRGLES
ncbi:MAG: iron ABC transporter permease [Planctomycetota bacterium]